ncbi:MAG TPA: DUF2398 family protein [Kofleriaceae bacterium]|jgi:hypothetical protein
MTAYFEKLNSARVTAILNVLVEAPFFYRDDEAELFQYLRRHRAEFERFYAELYGWELVVDARTARLYKERWHNAALKPSQHDVFALTRRLDCLGFLIVLEFYERLLEQQNLSSDDATTPRFSFGELFEFARDRLHQELAADAPDDDETRKMLRGLWPELERYRFVREVARELDDHAPDDDHVLYEALPALHHYDVRRLAPGALARAFGSMEVGAPHGDSV